MARRAKKEKPIQRKKVNVNFLPRETDGVVAGPYRLMERLIDNDHEHLSEARMAIAFVHERKPDPDGNIYIGDAKKGNDLDRELHGFDWVILLPHELWNTKDFTEDMMKAMLDHHLCKCAVLNDSNGEPKIDRKNRIVFRKRKHDVSAFTENVARYGFWHEGLRQFAEKALDRNRLPLFAGQDQEAPPEPAKKETKAPAKKASRAKSAAELEPSSSNWPAGKVPGRVKLIRDVEGRNNSEHELYAHVEKDVARIVNDAACVKSAAGELNQLHADQYVVLEWVDREEFERACQAVAGKVGAA